MRAGGAAWISGVWGRFRRFAYYPMPLEVWPGVGRFGATAGHARCGVGVPWINGFYYYIIIPANNQTKKSPDNAGLLRCGVSYKLAGSRGTSNNTTVMS